jgi:bifunctional enzyme CysN/CysC
VIRPHQDFRGFAGRIASGVIRPGQEVTVLPGGHQSRISRIVTAGDDVSEAVAGDSVVLTIEDEIDASRGSMIVRRMNVPTISTRIDAMMCWLNERPLDPSTRYVLMHTSRQTQAVVDAVVYRIDMDTLHREEVSTLGLNDIGRVELITAQPIFFDVYQTNRSTGSFILIDPHTNATVAAGMIRGETKTADGIPPEIAPAPNVVWQDWNIPRDARESQRGHKAAVLWFTGLSGAGKSTIARELERRLFERGCQTMLLDGDQMRHGLNADLRFGAADRSENIRRVGEVARLFFEQGSIVLCTFVSPYRRDRDLVRSKLPSDRFLEIHVHVELDVARQRDPKKLYAKAAAGEITDLTGVSAPYEAPTKPELLLDTTRASVDELVDRLLQELESRGIVRSAR